MEELLKKAVERELVKKASPNFTDHVMDSILKLEPVAEYRPIISKRGWLMIGIVLIAVSVFVIGLPVATNEGYFINLVTKINELFDNTRLEPSTLFSNLNMLVVLGGTLSVFLLLLFENLFFKKK